MRTGRALLAWPLRAKSRVAAHANPPLVATTIQYQAAPSSKLSVTPQATGAKPAAAAAKAGAGLAAAYPPRLLDPQTEASAFDGQPAGFLRDAMNPGLQVMAGVQFVDPRLKAIRDLLASGQKAAARTALEKLRIEHPDIVVDKALEADLAAP